MTQQDHPERALDDAPPELLPDTPPMAEPQSVFRVLLLGGSQNDVDVVEDAADSSLQPIIELSCGQRSARWADEVHRVDPAVAVVKVDVTRDDPLRSVKALIKRCPDLPIVVLVRDDQASLRADALEMGAEDFLIREEIELDRMVLIRSLRHAAIRHRRLAAFRDLVRRYNRDLERLKRHTDVDPVTGLANVRGLDATLSREADRVARGLDAAALVVEIDGWARLKERLGNPEAQAARQSAGEAICRALRGSDVIGRIKGTRFVSLLSGTTRSGARTAAERVRDAIAKTPLDTGQGGSLTVTASVAVLELDPGDDSLEKLLKRAEPLLDRARERGGGQLSLSWRPTPANRDSSLSAQQLVAAVAEPGATDVAAQAIVRLEDGRVVAEELLTRPELAGLEATLELFARSAELGCLTEVDRHCFRRCVAAARGRAAGRRCHVNVFPETLAEWGIETLAAELPGDWDPAGLGIEMRAQETGPDPAIWRPAVDRVRSLGIAFGLDNVGPGQASLASLLALAPDYIKLARHLVAGIGGHAGRYGAVRQVVSLADARGIPVIATGVANTADDRALRELGVAYALGKRYGDPEAVAVPGGGHRA